MTKWFLVLWFWFLATAIACQSGDDDDSTDVASTDDDGGGSCASCETTGECTEALGIEWACVDGCCAVYGDDVGVPFTKSHCESGTEFMIDECGIQIAWDVGDEYPCPFTSKFANDVCLSGNEYMLCLAYCYDTHKPDCDAAQECYIDLYCSQYSKDREPTNDDECL